MENQHVISHRNNGTHPAFCCDPEINSRESIDEDTDGSQRAGVSRALHGYGICRPSQQLGPSLRAQHCHNQNRYLCLHARRAGMALHARRQTCHLPSGTAGGPGLGLEMRRSPLRLVASPRASLARRVVLRPHSARRRHRAPSLSSEPIRVADACDVQLPQAKIKSLFLL
jgi:hypothetical protein